MQTQLMTKAQQKRVTNLRRAEATALHKPGVYHANLTGARRFILFVLFENIGERERGARERK